MLLDSGSRDGPVARLGGTGRVHDWSVSRRVVGDLDKPVILAGGLTPGNVADAVRTVRPFADDTRGAQERSQEGLTPEHPIRTGPVGMGPP